MTGWQPIETAPNDGSDILVWDTESERIHIAAWFPKTFGGFWDSADGITLEPSHWMPLPEAPTI